MNMLRVFMFLGAALLVTGCTSYRVLDKKIAAPDSGSIFILGVSPNNFRVKIFPGDVKDGVFRENGFRTSAYYGAPENGYVIGKAEPGDMLAITMVRKVESANDILGNDFLPCAGYKTMVFKIPNSKVIYLGDVDYKISGNILEARYSKNLRGAIAFLAENYPNITVQPELYSYELLPTTMSCTRNIYVPVYISR